MNWIITQFSQLGLKATCHSTIDNVRTNFTVIEEKHKISLALRNEQSMKTDLGGEYLGVVFHSVEEAKCYAEVLNLTENPSSIQLNPYAMESFIRSSLLR